MTEYHPPPEANVHHCTSIEVVRSMVNEGEEGAFPIVRIYFKNGDDILFQVVSFGKDHDPINIKA
jgi:hypothetical protein